MIEKNINHTLLVESLDSVFRSAEIFSFLLINFIYSTYTSLHIFNIEISIFLLKVSLKIVIVMIVAACLQFLLIKIYQVTEKQFSTQFCWKDRVTKDLRIIQSFIWKKKEAKWLFLSNSELKVHISSLSASALVSDVFMYLIIII